MLGNSEPKNIRKRDVSVDILRGIAICIMLGANVAGYVSPYEYHPLWFHIVSSFAAPLFISLSGYMVALNMRKKDPSLRAYLLRGGMVVLTGALIDLLLWRHFPLIEFDVLYLIGFGLPVVYMLERQPVRFRWGFIALILIVSAVLQKTLRYGEFPPIITFPLSESDISNLSFPGAIKSWLYDGWFPVFPWLAVSVWGGVLADIREKMRDNMASLKVVIAGAALTAAGFAWFYLGYSAENPFDALFVRAPYYELFYPATIPFLISAAGICMLLFSLADSAKNAICWKPLIVFGQASMFNYILHTGLVARVIEPYFQNNLRPMAVGWIVYASLTAFCFLCSCGIVLLKQKVRTKNFLFRFYCGG
jgi:uncharacterized membrane protein